MPTIETLDKSITDGLNLGPAMQLKARLPKTLPDFDKAKREADELETEIKGLEAKAETNQETLVTKKSKLTDKQNQLTLQKIQSKIEALEAETGDHKIAVVRNVKGDGNCFYRALMQSHLEQVIADIKLDELNELVQKYKDNFDKIKKEIAFTPTQKEEALITPEIFEAFIKDIKETKPREKRQQLLVKAFNHPEHNFDLSLVALTRYLLQAEAKKQLDKGVVTQPIIDNIKSMGEFVESTDVAAKTFADIFKTKVRIVSLTDGTFDRPYGEAKDRQVTVVHDYNHYYAAREQSVHTKISASFKQEQETVTGLKENADGYKFDESELTPQPGDFASIKAKPAGPAKKTEMDPQVLENVAKITGVTQTQITSIAKVAGIEGATTVKDGNSWQVENTDTHNRLIRSGSKSQMTYEVNLYDSTATKKQCIEALAKAYAEEFTQEGKDKAKPMRLKITDYKANELTLWQEAFKTNGFTHITFTDAEVTATLTNPANTRGTTFHNGQQTTATAKPIDPSLTAAKAS